MDFSLLHYYSWRQLQFFTITSEIHPRSLANFYCQYADRHMNLKFMRRVRARAGSSTICYRKKTNWCQFLMGLSCYWSWISSWHCQSSRGSTATLTMWWRNSWSITGQTHKKTDVNLLNIRPHLNEREIWTTCLFPRLGLLSTITVTKSRLFVNSDVTMIMIFPCPSFTQIQEQNERWLLCFWNCSGVGRTENIWFVFRGKPPLSNSSCGRSPSNTVKWN